MTDRSVELLKATLDLLREARRGPYVKDVFSLTVHYDDADCDGLCLMEDIEHFLEYEVSND
jgi:hypothetical protein